MTPFVALLLTLLLPGHGLHRVTYALPVVPPRLPVGWHDEMNDPTLWQPLSMENQADVRQPRPGRITLRLPHVPQGFAYPYQWSGVTRNAVVNLARYPMLVARISRLEPGTYAHLDIQENDIHGQAVHVFRTNTLTAPGLTSLDLGQAMGSGDTRRLVVRLIVGGKLEGAACDYDWVRFVRRQDMARLTAHPDTRHVVAPDGEPVVLRPAVLPSVAPPHPFLFSRPRAEVSFPPPVWETRWLPRSG